MYYDPQKNAMFDVETGALIPLTEGDEIPAELRAEVRGTSHIHRQIQQKKDFAYAHSLQTDPSDNEDLAHTSVGSSGGGSNRSVGMSVGGVSAQQKQQQEQEAMMQRDHDMAMALSLSSEQGSASTSTAPVPRPAPSSSSSSSSLSVSVSLPPDQQQQQQQRLDQEAADHAFALSLSSGNDIEQPPSLYSSSPINHHENPLQLESNPYFVGGIGGREVAQYEGIELMEAGTNSPLGGASGGGGGGGGGDASVSAPSGGGGWLDDLSLARALQAMEFEIASEMRGGEGGEGGGPSLTPEEEAFNRKENKASKCKRQMVTISTFLCLLQIGMLVAMIQDDGYAPKSENPMYGPSAYTLVRYGAKVAVLIKYEHEWWRLVTPVFLHAGVIHIISNVGIQLRVGGYLELVFGRASWLFIYFSSGIYGNMLSCIFLPDSVGIGSSGAVLGMLTAWIVWILFRWGKVPAESRGLRNCQLIVVTAAVVLTLAFSFTDFVDWAAHFGGSVQGGIAAAMMLSREVEHFYLRWGVRTLAALAFVVSYTWALVYMLEIMHPSKEYLEYYDQNDDWGR